MLGLNHFSSQKRSIAYSYSLNSTFDCPSPVGSNESAVYDLAIFNVTTPWGHNIDTYSIYTLTDNSTLKITISVNSSQTRAPLYMSMDESWNAANQTFTDSPESFFHIWDKEVTGNATFSVPLRSAKHYVLRIEAPGLLDAGEHYEASYTMSLGMESQGTITPFILGNRTEEASSGRFEGAANTTSLRLSQQIFWSDWVVGHFSVERDYTISKGT